MNSSLGLSYLQTVAFTRQISKAKLFATKEQANLALAHALKWAPMNLTYDIQKVGV
jgi:hypothetical protein